MVKPDAEAELRIALQKHPENAKFMVRLARVLGERAAWEEAIGLYRRALEIQPSNNAIGAELARIFSRCSDGIGADELLSRGGALLSMLPAKEQVRIAREQEAAGFLLQAVEIYRHALKSAPFRAEWVLELANVLADLGRYPDVEELLSLLPNSEMSPQLTQFRRFVDRAANHDLGSGVLPDAKLRYRMALHHLRGGRAVEALALFDSLTSQYPQFSAAWMGSLGARGSEPGSAEHLGARWLAAAPGLARGVAAALARPLSRRGLIFDPADRFPLVPMASALRRVDNPRDLPNSGNAYSILDPGGRTFTAQPFLKVEEGVTPEPIQITTVRSFMMAVDNALLVGRGCVITQDGRIITDHLRTARAHKYDATVEENVLRFDGFTFKDGMAELDIYDEPSLLLMGPTDLSYGDWLAQFPPRLLLAEKVGLNCDVLVNEEVPQQFLDMIHALGIPRERIKLRNPRRPAVFSRLFVPSWPYTDDYQPMADWCEIYGRLVPPPVSSPREKIFLSRKRVANRSLVNEDEIGELFASYGFRILYPEELSFAETLRVFSNTACVAGPFGSAFQNMLFCNHSAVALGLMPPYTRRYLRGVGTCMASMDVQFGYVQGVAAEAEPQIGPNFAPWTVELERAKRALDRLLDYMDRQAIY